jgi:DNA-binding transcriptional regulator PaaX
MSKGPGEIQRKIILLLQSGVALSLSNSPKRSLRIIKEAANEWKKIEDQKLKRSIRALYRSKMIREETDENGRIKIILTEKGKIKALSYQIFEIEIKNPVAWDRKWRMVIFDIPEVQKRKREIFRMHLRNLHFFELQKSVFVHPFDCQKEIEYIIEYYQLRKYVRFIIAESIDNELHLKDHFGLK